MRVTVEYFGPAREAAGVGHEVIDFDSMKHDAERRATLANLIRQLGRTHGERLSKLLLANGEISRSLVLAVNDVQVAADAELKDGDAVTIIPPVAGGSELTPDESATYEWQMWIPGLGEEGQRRLKYATVLVTRVGGVGGLAAYELAAAGVGKLVLAHAGSVKPSDLNRQLLMTHDSLGQSRVECAARGLTELNPRLVIESVPENVRAGNASRLVEMADLVVCCAPLFEERLFLNEQCVRQNKPMIDCAMYELTGQITTILPGRTACLACRVPEPPQAWKRQFPVLGAVSGTIGCLGAVEAIKLITGIGEPLADRMLMMDLREMRIRTIQLARRSDCKVCGQK